MSIGVNPTGVNISLAGLGFQVFTLCIFSGLAADYAISYYKARKSYDTRVRRDVPAYFKSIAVFIAIATILIITRCIYRIDELSNGYSGPLIHNQGLFIGLEGVVIFIACVCLILGHPGPLFQKAEGPSHKVVECAECGELMWDLIEAK